MLISSFYEVPQNFPILIFLELLAFLFFLALPGSVGNRVHWQNSLPFAPELEYTFL